ncbi:uncharacterized protein LOC115876429 [Sitophilus oryzae]|uniref:Uncharacterized protein LOC115876429 n=1 Tax=Sitophilus oryzae TaxID=7048 RepID=A0A6J2X9Y7_SITOR|nr:uncharacterized protein LOC115876429 [Sitophilus oryzae]
MDVFSYVLIVLTTVSYIPEGEAILCYHCHQTTKECNNGVLSSIKQKNCTEDKCAIIKYETLMPGRNVLATMRDCVLRDAEELSEKLHSIQKPKIIFNVTCSEPLCNNTITTTLSKNLLLLFVIFLFAIR